MSLSASQVIELKTKLKAELKRRNGLGSVAHLASAKYDFIETPEDGRPITADQGKKIIDLLIQIRDYKDLKFVIQGDTLPEAFDEELLTLVDELASEKRTGEPDEHSSCNGMCTGLCVGSCIGMCNGSTGSNGLSGVRGTIKK